MSSRSTRIGLLIGLPLTLGVVGFCSGLLAGMSNLAHRTDVVQRAHPLPHHIPKYAGNLTLRFAMVHDVIHERFPHHGPDYYHARNREVQKAIAGQCPAFKGKEADEYFRLLDDWAVGLEFLGRHRQAVALMHDKLQQQAALGYKDRDLYSTYANLGTFLILWQLSEGVNDVPQAKERIRESVQWVRKAIEVYPQSHFGREVWQVTLEEFLLAVLDNPELLLRYDMVGNRLDRPINPAKAVCFDEAKWLKSKGRWEQSLAARAESHLANPSEESNPAEYRVCIERVGAEDGWKAAVKTASSEPAAFDEPALGIVGMWRMGAGANPHFALALGEIMLRVGQRYIAWTAYERAHRLADHYWPDKRIQEKFAAHCRDRQRTIEKSLPDADWDAQRRQFEKELAFGQQYQKDYQDYESKRLAEGDAITDPHFYEAFEASRDPIATPPGDEDRTFSRVEVTHLFPAGGDLLAWCLLFAGVFSCAVAACQTLYQRMFGRG